MGLTWTLDTMRKSDKSFLGQSSKNIDIRFKEHTRKIRK